MHRGGATQDAQERGYAEGLQKGASVNREPVLEIDTLVGSPGR